MTVNNQSESKLTALQLELLKIYAFEPTEAELIEVKNMLARFFAHRFTDGIAEAAAAKGISDADLDQWLEEDAQ